MKKWGSRSGGHADEQTHGSRPWVYFMVDCFFLITIFFVCTFKVRTDELNLVSRLPPGAHGIPTRDITDLRTMNIHVSRDAGAPAYEYLTRRSNLNGLNDTLAGVAGNGGAMIRISYDRDVPFTDVLAVFNACNRVGLMKYGLVPLCMP